MIALSVEKAYAELKLFDRLRIHSASSTKKGNIMTPLQRAQKTKPIRDIESPGHYQEWVAFIMYGTGPEWQRISDALAGNLED